MTCRLHPKALNMLLLPLAKGRIALYLGSRELKTLFAWGLVIKNLSQPWEHATIFPIQMNSTQIQLITVAILSLKYVTRQYRT